jgi:hypothetical protein
MTAETPLDPEAEVNIITTAPGTFSSAGLVPVGTKGTVPVKKFSRAWMRPAGPADAKIVNPWLKAKDDAAEAAAADRSEARVLKKVLGKL